MLTSVTNDVVSDVDVLMSDIVWDLRVNPRHFVHCIWYLAVRPFTRIVMSSDRGSLRFFLQVIRPSSFSPANNHKSTVKETTAPKETWSQGLAYCLHTHICINS